MRFCRIGLARIVPLIMRTRRAATLLSCLGLCLFIFVLWNVKTTGYQSRQCKPLVFAAFGRKLEGGHLAHVFDVLNNAGYTRDTIYSDWDLLWSHEYPFRVLKDELIHLDAHKKVNHFPGSGYITNKVNLATSGLSHVPVAFKIPEQKKNLIKYANENPESLFVQKSNNHRGIRIQPVSELDLETKGTFVQKYIDNPLLIDGHKFDIGIYTIITSIQPLRAYIYDGDVLFRFCPVEYHPFNASVVDKYVIRDDYLPIWEVKSLKRYFDAGFGMRESFNAYFRSINKDPRAIWLQVDEAIRTMLLSREMSLVAASSKFASTRNFFEMIRVDFVVDDDLNVFIMEANMSPNLSSHHFAKNRLLYEQVIFNSLKLVGVVPATCQRTDKLANEYEVAFKDLAVFPEKCANCEDCSTIECKLCQTCVDESFKGVLKEAFREHTSRNLCRRIVPPTLVEQEVETGVDIEGLTEVNQMMHLWFHGKCKLDPSWC